MKSVLAVILWSEQDHTYAFSVEKLLLDRSREQYEALQLGARAG
jgi:hypothetical protein